MKRRQKPVLPAEPNLSLTREVSQHVSDTNYASLLQFLRSLFHFFDWRPGERFFDELNSLWEQFGDLDIDVGARFGGSSETGRQAIDYEATLRVRFCSVLQRPNIDIGESPCPSPVLASCKVLNTFVRSYPFTPLARFAAKMLSA